MKNVETYSYFKIYVDPHGLTVKVFNGGEDMFPKDFFDECRKAEADRGQIANLSCIIAWHLRSGMSEENRQEINRLRRKRRYLSREYEADYGITYAKSERLVAKSLKSV
ncbi:hypothetical protein TKK_0019405 [Trichogramma kaykai]|uniref:Uncharacterized protein n=1 Tax=Trichogramma kaykai TaxID=54128 RepID=A0ABD2VTP8_9HYME